MIITSTSKGSLQLLQSVTGQKRRFNPIIAFSSFSRTIIKQTVQVILSVALNVEMKIFHAVRYGQKGFLSQY